MLDQKWAEACDYLESLPDWRTPTISLGFTRADDFRRKAMLKNKTPLISYSAWISICLKTRREMETHKDGPFYELFNSHHKVSPAEAVDDVLRQLKQFLTI